MASQPAEFYETVKMLSSEPPCESQDDNRNTTEMTNKNKSLQDQDNTMTSFSREDYAQNSQHSGSSHKGDELGANSEIGTKLRALYSSIQDETIPERFLDLLEKLDQAERKSASHSRN